MGDLLTFAAGSAPISASISAPAPGLAPVLGLALGPRHGLLRGTSAVRWYDLGCQLESSDPASAIAAYERAVAGCPGMADAHNNLGRLLHDRGALAAAEICYRLAICAAPDVALYWFNLGVAVEDQGRRAEAIAAYERALALDDRLADAHYNLARLLELAARRTASAAAHPAIDDAMLRCAVRHLLRYRRLSRRGAQAR